MQKKFFGRATTIPQGEHGDSSLELSHRHRKKCVMGLGDVWGGDTSGDTPPSGAAVLRGAALPALGWGLQTRLAPGGGWDKAAASERGLNDSVFGGCCLI